MPGATSTLGRGDRTQSILGILSLCFPGWEAAESGISVCPGAAGCFSRNCSVSQEQCLECSFLRSIDALQVKHLELGKGVPSGHPHARQEGESRAWDGGRTRFDSK